MPEGQQEDLNLSVLGESLKQSWLRSFLQWGIVFRGNYSNHLSSFSFVGSKTLETLGMNGFSESFL